MYVRFFLAALLLAGLAMSGGCGSGGAVSRMRGEVATEESYGVEQTYDAARQAMDVLKLKIIDDETGVDAMSAHVTARDSSDTKIYIRLKAITANVTRIVVQVGAFGDEIKSRRIFDTIRECLQNGETSAEPQEPASVNVLPLPIPVSVEAMQAAPFSPDSSQATPGSSEPTPESPTTPTP